MNEVGLINRRIAKVVAEQGHKDLLMLNFTGMANARISHILDGRGQAAGSRVSGPQEQQNEQDKQAVHDKGIPDKT